jgi:hypothetical protein
MVIDTENKERARADPRNQNWLVTVIPNLQRGPRSTLLIAL